jgi:hypothetical protein
VFGLYVGARAISYSCCFTLKCFTDSAIDYLGGTSGKGSGLTLLPLALPRGILTISNLEYLAQMFDADTQLP